MPALAKFALIVHSVSGGNAVLMLHPAGSTDAEGAKLKLRGISARLAGELEAARLDEQPLGLDLVDLLQDLGPAEPEILEPVPQFPAQTRSIQAFVKGKWRAAVVTEAHGPFCVNAFVYDLGEVLTSLTHVNEDEHAIEHSWRWPPRVTDYESYVASVEPLVFEPLRCAEKSRQMGVSGRMSVGQSAIAAGASPELVEEVLEAYDARYPREELGARPAVEFVDELTQGPVHVGAGFAGDLTDESDAELLEAEEGIAE